MPILSPLSRSSYSRHQSFFAILTIPGVLAAALVFLIADLLLFFFSFLATSRRQATSSLFMTMTTTTMSSASNILQGDRRVLPVTLPRSDARDILHDLKRENLLDPEGCSASGDSRHEDRHDSSLVGKVSVLYAANRVMTCQLMSGRLGVDGSMVRCRYHIPAKIDPSS